MHTVNQRFFLGGIEPTDLHPGDVIKYLPEENTMHILRGTDFVLLGGTNGGDLTLNPSLEFRHPSTFQQLAQFIAAAAGLGLQVDLRGWSHTFTKLQEE